MPQHLSQEILDKIKLNCGGEIIFSLMATVEVRQTETDKNTIAHYNNQNNRWKESAERGKCW